MRLQMRPQLDTSSSFCILERKTPGDERICQHGRKGHAGPQISGREYKDKDLSLKQTSLFDFIRSISTYMMLGEARRDPVCIRGILDIVFNRLRSHRKRGTVKYPFDWTL